MQTNFENHMPPPGETKEAAHNYPDIMFSDGRMMCWDVPTAKYQPAPVGYLPATRGVQMGDMVFFPVAGAEFVGFYPGGDPVADAKQQAQIQWIKTLGHLRWVAMFGGIGVVCVIIKAVAGYLMGTVAAFTAHGAPLVATAVGNVVSVLLWGIGIFIACFFFYSIVMPSLMYARTNIPTDPGTPHTDKAGAKQGATVNINVNQYAGDVDNAQNFINQM